MYRSYRSLHSFERPFEERHVPVSSAVMCCAGHRLPRELSPACSRRARTGLLDPYGACQEGFAWLTGQNGVRTRSFGRSDSSSGGRFTRGWPWVGGPGRAPCGPHSAVLLRMADGFENELARPRGAKFTPCGGLRDPGCKGKQRQRQGTRSVDVFLFLAPLLFVLLLSVCFQVSLCLDHTSFLTGFKAFFKGQPARRRPISDLRAQS